MQLNAEKFLREILRTIAHKSDITIVAPRILTESTKLIGADAAFYLLLGDPRLLFLENLNEADFPSDEWLQQYSEKRSSGIHLSADIPPMLAKEYTGWITIPIFQKRALIGVFGLFFKRDVVLDEDLSDLLMALLDALIIVSNSARAEAHHAKLTRNQNEFVRIVSHDLRSPLTSIKGFASMLESKDMGDINEKQLHFVEKILSGVSQMTSLVDNIQDAGRYDPETGFYEMERSPTDLIDMVYGIVKNHLVPAEKQELTLNVKVADNIPIVNVDGAMIERSVINLVDNAIKYTPNGGNIEVGLRTENNHILITVTDTGYGISHDNLRYLFQRHFRIRRKEHRRVKGTGLGLFIVRSVALHHGGDAFVESIEGEGSTFGISLPLSSDNLFGAAQES